MTNIVDISMLILLVSYIVIVMLAILLIALMIWDYFYE